MFNIDIVNLIIMLCAFLIAVIGHEIMHGVSALYYGDETAKLSGRITINPIKHIDILGSIIVPISLFLLQAPFMLGWAKPVPVNISEVIRNGGYNGAIIVSLAGIIYNILLAVIASVIFKSGLVPLSNFGLLCYQFLVFLVVTNSVLAVFNLLPIPPLDGSQALGYLSLKFDSDKIPIFFNKIERFGILILMGILMLPPVANLVSMPMKLLINFLL